MRIWFVPVTELDDRHLLGEHLELHVIANELISPGGGWRNHPAVKLFRGKLGALYRRHEEEVAEMRRRGFDGHKTPFPAEHISLDQMDAAIEITPEMLEKDRRDLAERQRLSEEHGGMSWRKAKVIEDSNL
ncbi:MAG: pyrimidine dimer DNA glycosylase/endonuclease V [Armatimonadota bacterium]